MNNKNSFIKEFMAEICTFIIFILMMMGLFLIRYYYNDLSHYIEIVLSIIALVGTAYDYRKMIKNDKVNYIINVFVMYTFWVFFYLDFFIGY